MKLTKQKIKELIAEVISEKRKNSMILTEDVEEPEAETIQMTDKDSFDEIIDVLEGRNPSVKTVGIMSAQNPMAQKVSTAENSRLANALLADLDRKSVV